MANYEINLTATQIEAALNKAHAPATAVDATQNLVESGAIKTYVDTQVSSGASITTASFAGSALEDSEDGLTATDTAVPTSAAVKNYVDAATSAPPTPNNRLRIKMLPNDFNTGLTASVGGKIQVPSGGFIVASTDIPAGYKATHFTLTTSGQNATAEVYEGQVDDDSLTSKGTSYATGTRTINITDVTGSDDNYLIVKLSTGSGSARYYRGGYFTLAEV